MTKQKDLNSLIGAITAILAGWALGAVVAVNVLKSNLLSGFGIAVIAISTIVVIICWLAFAVRLRSRARCSLKQARDAAISPFIPLLLLLSLQSGTLNDFLGLQRPILAATAVMIAYGFFRAYAVLNVATPRPAMDGAWSLFLVATAMIFFWRIVLVSPLHAGSMAEDILMFFPFKAFAAEVLRSGTTPLWNPYVFSGTPFLADSQTAVFHPATLMLALLAKGSLSYRAGELAVVVQFCVAVIGMYAYLRSLRLERWSSAAGALVFTFGGFMVSHVRHLPIINVAVWLPWFLYAVERFAGSRRLIWGVIGSVFLLFAFLGGHLQTVLYVFSFGLIYCVWRVYPEIIAEERVFARISLGLRSMMPFPAALLLGAFQLLPTLELLPLSTRAIDVSYHLTTDFSMPLQNLIMTVAPNFMGGIAGRYWGAWSYWWEFGSYVGIFALLAATTAAFVRRSRFQVFYMAAAVISLLLALGANTFLHPLFYLIWPGFHLNRAPSRLLLIFTFSTAVLCAYGLEKLLAGRNNDALLDTAKRGLSFFTVIMAIMLPFMYAGLIAAPTRRLFEYFGTAADSLIWALVLTGLSLVVLASLRNSALKDGTIKAMMISLIIFDLFSIWRGWYVEERRPETYFPSDAVIDYLRSDKDMFRVDNRDVWPPNAGSVYRIQTVSGSNTLSLADQSRIAGLPKLLNVKYMVARKDLDDPIWKKVRVIDGVSVYRYRAYVPRAYLVSAAQIEPDRETILKEISDAEFSPQDLVYLEDASLRKKIARLSKLPMDYNIELDSYEPNRLKYHVNNAEPGLMVLSEIYYPGWKARVDGRDANIYRADYALRAVWLEPGRHEVEMSFLPPSFLKGLYVSLITVSILIIMLAAEEVFRRKMQKR